VNFRQDADGPPYLRAEGEDARAAAKAGSLAERRWELLAETEEAVLVPPKHPNYPAVEDAIWEGIREALLGSKSVEQALSDTEAAARYAATTRG
jgi:multiple sugar transport system substrate-binding protein